MPLNGLLKNIYFHELGDRERIFTRLQLNFGAYVTALTIMAYMARMVDYSSPCWTVTLFYTGLFLALIPILISMRYTLIAFTGYRYALFPSATLSVKHKIDLDHYYESLSDQKDDRESSQGLNKSEQMLEDYVLESIAACIDKNLEINEQRRRVNRKALLQLLYAAIPLTISACLFVFFDLDASSPRKNSLREDSRLRESIVQSSDRLYDSINLLAKEISKMPDENNTQSSQQQQKPQPAPSAITPPQRPPLQYSTEDYKAPLPDKSKLLNEGK